MPQSHSPHETPDDDTIDSIIRRLTAPLAPQRGHRKGRARAEIEDDLESMDALDDPTTTGGEAPKGDRTL